MKTRLIVIALLSLAVAFVATWLVRSASPRELPVLRPTEDASSSSTRRAVDDGFASVATSAARDPETVQYVEAMFNTRDQKAYDLQSLQVQVDAWMGMARGGDLKAARSVWRALLACSSKGWAPYSRKSYDDYREEIIQSAAQRNSLPDEKKLQRLALMYSKCGDISPRQRALGLEALNLLAESGDWEGVRDLAVFGRPDVSDRSQSAANRELGKYRQKATELLDKQVSSGNVDAMLLKSALHAAPDFSGSPSILEVDRVRAMAYHLAAQRTLKRQFERAPPVSAEERMLMQGRIEQIEKDAALLSLSPWNKEDSLSSAQVAEASRLADAIVQGCCK